MIFNIYCMIEPNDRRAILFAQSKSGACQWAVEAADGHILAS